MSDQKTIVIMPIPMRDYLRLLKHLHESIRLMEQSRSAVKSKTIAQARAEAEKARAILESLL